MVIGKGRISYLHSLRTKRICLPRKADGHGIFGPGLGQGDGERKEKIGR